MSKQHYTGLNDQQVLESRRLHGSNLLTPAKKESLWKKYFQSLTGPLGRYIPNCEPGDSLIFILEIAALLSLFISVSEFNGWFGLSPHDISVFLEPLGILLAILLATGIAFYFEVKANKAFEILNQVNDDEQVQVFREGNVVQVPRRDIVVGDVVILSTGDEVPADAELLEAIALQIDESTLTGEPICPKTTDPAQFDSEATYPSNHVLRGTKVMEGHGICSVLAVGDKTESGKVFKAAQIDNSVKTPLNEQLDRLGRLITIASYAIAALIIIGRSVVYFADQSIPLSWGELTSVAFLSYLLQTVMIAVTLIVVAVPEGLPMAVSLSLAYSMRRMLKTSNLVRKMHACETMGATTVICTDKTGTLTENQMRIHETQFYGLPDQQLSDSEMSTMVCESIALNSTASLDYSNPHRVSALGNPTEGALLLWLEAQGEKYYTWRERVQKVDEIPFSTERKYMVSIVESSLGRRLLYIKGAPEIVLSMCRDIAGDGISKEQIAEQLHQYQSQAMRTIGFAYQELREGEGIVDRELVADRLTFMGIVAISDPVRSDVPAAVAECIEAGIAVKIVTGDTPGTALEIGRQIGLIDRNASEAETQRALITGSEFAALSDDALLERVDDLRIISRARPMDKKRLVETLQKLNHVVSVTGDGTNDAPALKAAHVGLSMGDGTSVAKEASDITIIDNSFSSIGRAVLWGRSLYQNIQRFILFQLTVNVVACLIVLCGAFMGTESPLTVTQMLWVNLIMDTFAAMALASLPPNQRVMKARPRSRTAFILTKSMSWQILGVGGLFFVALLAFLYILQHSEVQSMTDLFNGITLGSSTPHLSHYELSIFFTTFVMLQFWNIFNARAFRTRHSAFRLKGCRGFFIISLVILFGQVFIVTLGGEMFSVVPLKIIDWVIIIGSTSLVLWSGELIRLFFFKRG